MDLLGILRNFGAYVAIVWISLLLTLDAVVGDGPADHRGAPGAGPMAMALRRWEAPLDGRPGL